MPNRVHRRTVRIAWGDCDPAQIVFYPNYVAMFDESTAEMFRAALGLPKIQWTKKFGLVGFPMVDTRAKFIIPSFYGDDIVIESRVAEFRTSSFDVVHKVLKGDTPSTTRPGNGNTFPAAAARFAPFASSFFSART